jgi:predicted  nucleic acid-binding Zn-ribbon protein
MLPEISHRCQSCGASIRDPEMFCPECGQPLAPASAAPPSPENGETPKPAEADNEAEVNRAMLLETANAATDIFSTANQPSAIAELESAGVSTDKPPAAEVEPALAPVESGSPPMNPSAPVPPAAKHGKYEKARDSLHRASTATRAATREALADNVKRVERIRHVSTVVLEEASYDPSLRFVLVALGLFLVFLVLLLLSKVMG